ncbi:MAG: hypothetical protein GEV28_15715 [Actinophytocola sp.]|uniref:hypothetical protein n=1 Tax=Actinophytocola sp. TaxID=1872138 RepID=UPI0013273364|nr:hypothetical protein [Actinophytocola sp.]MPZ81767.1 hypothetical protein [Actinophytocola sp.]
MTEFTTVLYSRIEAAQQGLALARQAGDDREIHRHSARLLDLLDRAAATDVNTTGWVAPAVLDVAAGHCA